ncbi:MAG: metallophosphoesterase family protein [Crocinitomicaceae bacterium]
MKRTLVIGDIHGGLKALLQVLERAQVSEEDTLIFLGDYVDGWSQSAGVMDYLIQLQRRQSCIFIKGNHDAWCEDWLRTGKPFPLWLQHGGQSTLDSYTAVSKEERAKHLAFFQAMPHYHIDSNKRLFVHAGFTSMHGVEKEFYESNFSWDRTLWEMAWSLRGVELDENSPTYPQRFRHYSEIFIGHTPTTHHGQDTPIFAQKLVNVDTGAAFKGKLTLMDIDTKEFWQSEPLPSLYPNEKGRN